MIAGMQATQGTVFRSRKTIEALQYDGVNTAEIVAFIESGYHNGVPIAVSRFSRQSNSGNLSVFIDGEFLPIARLIVGDWVTRTNSIWIGTELAKIFAEEWEPSR